MNMLRTHNLPKRMPQVPVTENTFARLVGNYIKHAQVLNNTSDFYKKRMDFLRHLGKCDNILVWLEAHDYNVGLRALCKQLCENREHLYGILPFTGNPSYRNSLRKITNIIDAAEKALRGENFNVSELQ
jgi:hypothetical protein